MSSMKPELKVAQALTAQRKTLAIAESCTGGLLSHRLTNIPGSSNFLKFGLVAYSNETKTKLLKISPIVLKTYGAVSQPVAMAMAKGVRRLQKTDFGVGITGIAGPTGATKKKPIGLIYIAINNNKETLCLECHFHGNRTRIKSQATTQALDMLLEFLN